jgi:UDP-glucose 4-epimerase
MRILITGGAGFIGSHLADHYLAIGNEVVLLDNLSTGSRNNLKGAEVNCQLIDGDIRNSDLVSELVEKSDLVLHMAAALGVSTILHNPIESISTNIHGSETVMLAAAKHKKRIIIASTSEIYGKNPKQPLNELDDRVIGSPQNIRWSYSDAKAIEEATATALNKSQGLKVTTVRFFNTVGPRQTGQYGMVVPRFVQSALANEEIQVYGDGNQTRVFCHVNDAIAAVVKLAETDSTISEVYNVGGVGEISINNLAEKIISTTKSASNIRHIPYDQAYPSGFEDMQRRVPDTSKIQSAIGWKPQMSLEDIIQDVSNYFKSK